jgi:DsbC/DsbD-like thiol-disulfide interchange protein
VKFGFCNFNSRLSYPGYNKDMLGRRNLTVALILSILSVQSAKADVAQPCQARLIASTGSPVAGHPFFLGVLFTIDPNWHIYWKNAGDAGIPTRVRWKLPPGFSAGPLQFPTPKRMELPGDILDFGYENSVLIFTQITPPADLPADFSGDFHADVNWLVCSDACIPGKDSLDLTLKSSSTPADSADSPLFDAWQSRVPVEVSGSPDAAGASVSGELTPQGNIFGGPFVLTLTWKKDVPKSIEFLFGNADAYTVSHGTMQTHENQTTINFNVQTMAGRQPDKEDLEVVIGYSAAGSDDPADRRGISIKVPLPAADVHY